jgi:hypothetical protein
MDKKDNKLSKIVVKIFYLLLISFIVLYFSKINGYYEFVNHNQVEMTDNEIKKFEKDIKDGKNITAKDYIKDNKKTYNNLISDMGYNLSEQVSSIVTNGLDSTFGFLGQLFS